MTREEAIQELCEWLQQMIDHGVPNYSAKREALAYAISALSAEPIKVITDDTIEVRYTDFENIKRIILTNGDIFCKMFYEDNTQDDDSDYDSLVPDEYKTDGDLISRADAIERIANDNVVGGMDRINEYRNSNEHNDYLDGISTAIATVDDLPSADAEQVTGKLQNPCDSLLTEDSDDSKEQKSKLKGKSADICIIDEPIVDHDREWIIGCIKHDGFIKTDRFDKANKIIVDALESCDRPSVEIKECKPLCTEQKIAVEEFLNAPRITEECAIELLQMTGWLQEHDKEIGRPSGEWEHWGSPFSEDDIINTMVCTNCGMRFVEIKGETFYFCPNCGATMENTK